MSIRPSATDRKPPSQTGSRKAARTSMLAQCEQCGATATATGTDPRFGIAAFRVTSHGTHEGCGGHVRVYRL